MLKLILVLIFFFNSSTSRYLVLTIDALYLVVQQRPIDYVYSLLSSIRMESGDFHEHQAKIFDHFGVDQVCAMCVAIACGLPGDLGTPFGDDFNSQNSRGIVPRSDISIQNIYSIRSLNSSLRMLITSER